MPNYRVPEMTPAISPIAQLAMPGGVQAPADAVNAYFYSQQQAALRGPHGMVQQGPGRSKLPYTETVALTGPDAQHELDDYLHRFPDAQLVTFGNAHARRFSLSRGSEMATIFPK